MSDAEAAQSWKINENHWDNEKVVVFRVEDELFKLNLSRLTDVSEGFEAILNLPGVEGTVENPLYMGESVSKAEFRAFLEWIKHTAWAPLPSNQEDLLLSILKISHKWICEPGMQYAVRMLDYSLDVYKRIELAQAYGIPSWVKRAVPIRACEICVAPPALQSRDLRCSCGLLPTKYLVASDHLRLCIV
ncbi:hypothetical protein K435DRAFT_793390 [Dendrothele bispora CBS 962.96]|uniref:BTB domain-containing protein n=1 Tax=Dendrothele bispora (strain CBS 962.96) TaxID=1314807 RepID=A0A4S8MFA0_DENBC|nr:hypothetical protein K435DRAFT_793390 [Dendrothele bispora CBS 962.96]